jgi:hypothetical protein
MEEVIGVHKSTASRELNDGRSHPKYLPFDPLHLASQPFILG